MSARGPVMMRVGDLVHSRLANVRHWTAVAIPTLSCTAVNGELFIDEVCLVVEVVKHLTLGDWCFILHPRGTGWVGAETIENVSR